MRLTWEVSEDVHSTHIDAILKEADVSEAVFYLLSNGKAIETTIKLLVILHLAARNILGRPESMVSEQLPDALRSFFDRVWGYYEAAMVHLAPIRNRAISWVVGFLMVWIRASPGYLCTLNSLLLSYGEHIAAWIPDKRKEILQLDCSQAKE